MKRTRRRLTAVERDLAYAFHDAVAGRPCVVCGRWWAEPDAHHGIDAGFLRRHHLPVYDVRNAVPVCPMFVGPCHGDHTSGMRRMARGKLPASVEEFAEEHGLGWYLDRYYPAESEAA